LGGQESSPKIVLSGQVASQTEKEDSSLEGLADKIKTRVENSEPETGQPSDSGQTTAKEASDLEEMAQKLTEEAIKKNNNS